MGSFIKKNRTQASKIKNILVGVMKEKYRTSERINSYMLELPVYKIISRDERYKDLIVSAEVYLKSLNIEIVELKDKVCFCLDLRGIALRQTGIDDSMFYHSVHSSVHEQGNESLIKFLNSLGVDTSKC